MANYFITRHQGAVDWATDKIGDQFVAVNHFDPEIVVEGDQVAGTLPVHLAAEVCRRGGRYLHLVLDLPADARGKELSAKDMESFGARLEEYLILHPASGRFLI